MNPNREELLFQLALSKPAAKRAAWLDAECEGDAALRQRLEALLAAHEQPETLSATQAEAARPTLKLDLADAPDEAVGQTIGRYKLLEKIGEGGCGVVYVAEQTEPVRRRVALKVIKLGMDTKAVVARFEAERQALAMMDHPNIAKVLDAGMTGEYRSADFSPPDRSSAHAPSELPERPPISTPLRDKSRAPFTHGRPYFVMELVRGIKITDYCDQANLSTKERLDLFIKVCHAIQHAHQKGIIHRDIKPSNILVTLHDGVPVPKVIDFGIAKATEGRLTDNTVYTQLHQFIGTPTYMSPEQAEMSGLDIDTRSDIYSLGVLLYELLAGSTPFDPKELMASGIDAMRKTIREKEPMRPSTRLTQELTLGVPPSGGGASALATLRTVANAGPPEGGTPNRDAARIHQLKVLIATLKGDLDWIVMKCLEKDRTRRYETANGLAADLKRHLSNEPVVARPPSTAYRFQKAFRRNKVAFTAATAVGLALVLAVVVSTWQARVAIRARRAEEMARRTADENAQAAKHNAARAETERLRAGASELAVRRHAYASDVNLAQQALAVGNLGRAVECLGRQRPRSRSNGDFANAEVDLRGWEWRYLWRQCQSQALLTLCQKGIEISSLAASHDGKWLAIGQDSRGGLSVWDTQARQEVMRWPLDRGTVLTAFSPKEPLLAFSVFRSDPPSSHRPNSVQLVQLWDAATRQSRGELPLSDYCNGLVFSADGLHLVASTGPTDKQLVLWRVADRQKIRSVPAIRESFSGMGQWLVVAPDLSAAAFSDGAFVRAVDLNTGAERWKIKTAQEVVLTLALSPDGKTLATGAGWVEADIRLWDFATGREVKRLQGHRSFVSALAFWPDGKTLASAGGDQSIRLWDLNDPSNAVPPPRVLLGHRSEVWSLALFPDGVTLASGCKDGSVCLWNVANTRQREASIVIPVQVSELAWAFTPDSKSVVTVDTQGEVAKWHEPDFQIKQPTLQLGTNYSQVRISPDARRVATISGKNLVSIWDVAEARLVRQFPGTSRFGWFLNGSERLMLYEPADETMHEWDLVQWQEIRSWKRPVDAGDQNFSRDERLLIDITQGGLCTIKDLATGKQRSGPLDFDQVSSIDFSPDAKVFAASSWRGLVKIWETETLREAAALRGFLIGVQSVTFSRDGTRLLTSSSGKEAIRLWDTGSFQELITLGGEGSGFSYPTFSPDGNLLGSMNFYVGRLHLWRAPSWEEIAAAEAKDPPAPGYGGQGKAESKQP